MRKKKEKGDILLETQESFVSFQRGNLFFCFSIYRSGLYSGFLFLCVYILRSEMPKSFVSIIVKIIVLSPDFLKNLVGGKECNYVNFASDNDLGLSYAGKQR